MIRIRSLRQRLFIWNIFVLTVALHGLGFIVHLVVLADLTKQSDAHLLAAADSTASLATAILSEDPKTAIQASALIRKVHAGMGAKEHQKTHITGPESQAVDARMRIFGPDGGLLFREWFKPASNDKAYDNASLQIALGGLPDFRTIRLGAERFRLLSKPVKIGGKVRLVVQVAESENQIDQGVAQVDHVLLHLAPIAVLLAGFGGLIVSAASLRPVGRMVAAVRKIDADNLGQRVTVESDKELAELGSAFNVVLERLDASFESQKRFIQDASHELRTPLTAIKVNTSVALSGPPSLDDYRTALVGADRAADRMMRLVNDLLFLSRTESKQLPIERHRVPLAESIKPAIEMFETQAKQKGVTLCSCELPDAAILADAYLVDRVLNNILANALANTMPGGTISISASEQGGMAEISVSDTGSGIAPEHLEHVFERFYRVDSSRSRHDGGTGLGLSICRSICEAHGGSIQIASRVNEGTTVTIRLPLDK